MSAILAFLLPMLSSLPGTIGDYFKGQQEIEKLKQQSELELQRANLQLSGDLAKARLEYQKESLKATGMTFKYFTFAMWFGPYMMQIIWPSMGKKIFDNMLGMPEWYAQSCVVIMFTVWGISVSAPVVANIFTGLSSYFQGRREYKLEKAKIDRKAFFDGMRKIFPKGMTQSQVDVMEEALNEGEK